MTHSGRVATIEVWPQAFDTPQRHAFGDGLELDPEHAVEAHLPLGGIDRARREVYPVSTAGRGGLRGGPSDPMPETLKTLEKRKSQGVGESRR